MGDYQHVSIGYLRKPLRAPHSEDRQHFALVADLIEAQQAEIERLRAERDAERALADQLARALCIAVPWRCCDESRFRRCDCAPDDARIPEHEADAAVLASYKEARRG